MKYDPHMYQQPWRPNYEFRSAVVWLLGALFAVAAAFTITSVPSTPFYAFAIASVVLGTSRIRPAYVLNRLQKSLQGHPLKFIPIDQLKQILEKNPDKLWLGYGFNWEKRHVQRVYEILKRDWSEVVNETNESIGRPWLHGVEPDEIEILQPIAHAEGHTLIAGTTGSGKAQPMDALVLTDIGWKQMGSLILGESVITPSGQKAEIKGIYPQGILKVYKILLSDGRFAEACLDHLWFSIIDGEPSHETLTTRDLLNLHKQGKTLALPLTDFGLPAESDQNLPSYNAGATLLLHLDNIATAQSLVDATHFVDYQDRVSFVQGLLNTYAHFCSTQNCLEFLVPCKDLALALQKLFWSIGGISAIERTQNGYLLTFNHTYLQKFVSNPKIKEQLNSKPLRNFVQIVDITYSREAASQCIYVDHPDHLYVTNDYIVTHNTRMFDQLITQSIFRGECVWIIDPKGDREMRNLAQLACKHAGREGDFIEFHPAFPERSIRLDPLANFNRSTELASRIAALIATSSGGEVFKDFSQMALNNLIQGYFLCEERPSLVGLRNYLEAGPQELVVRSIVAFTQANCPSQMAGTVAFSKAKGDFVNAARDAIKFYYNSVKPIKPSVELEGLISMQLHDRTHFSKMVASLLPIMNMLTSDSLGALLSPCANKIESVESPAEMFFDSRRIIDTNKVFYLGLDSLSDSIIGSAIGSLILSDLTAVAGDRYNFGDNLKAISLYIDEAAEVVNDPMIQMLNKARGSKFRLTVATQTFSDFAARLGSKEKATQVLGNFNNFIALRLVDNETQKYMSEKLPLTRINYIMQSQGSGTNSENPLLFGGQHSERLMEEETSFFSPELFGMLPNLEYIANLSGGRIIKGRLPILIPPEEKTKK